MRVLGIAVDEALARRWVRWLAPEVQPFFVRPSQHSLAPWLAPDTLTPELGHTCRTWRIDPNLEVRWLDEQTLHDLPRPARGELVRSQAIRGRGAVPSVRRWATVVDRKVLRGAGDGHRFVWWPSMLSHERQVLPLVISAAPDGAAAPALASRHAEIGRKVWGQAAPVVPGAEALAGTFARSSGPNCFATVMAAAGVPGVEDECVVEEPFLHWLATATVPGGRDGEPGTVLLWRDERGAPVHAAMTIGGGFVLEKASAEWWTPRAVRSAGDVIHATRAAGQRLERHRIAGGTPA